MPVFANTGSVAVVSTLNGPLSIVTNNSNDDHRIAPFHFGVDSPDPKFTGRSHELARLRDATINHQNVPGHQVPIAVVCGLGGVGKTQLVRKFIDINDFHYTNVIWINSEEHSSMVSQFKVLATSYLKISTESNGNEKALKDLIGEVFHKLSTSPTLIVLDNVDETKNSEIVKSILTMGTSATRPHVLITTRIQNWHSIHRLILNVFSDDDALEYVKTKLTDPDNVHKDSVEDKMKLAETLQSLPLTLAQAIAHINDRRRVGVFYIGDYLTEYNSSTEIERIFDSRIFQSDELNLYESTTLRTWKVTTNAIIKLGATGHLALRILRIIAYFNPDHIRRDIFFNLKSPLREQITEKEVTSAISLLVNFSMVGSQKQESVLNIHRVVQRVTKIELENDADVKLSILRDGLQLMFEMQQKETFNECNEHGISIYREAIKFAHLVHEYKTIPAAIIRSLNRCQKQSRGRDFGDAILEQFTTILGENNLDAVDCKFVTAGSYYNLGKINEASKFYHEVYDKRKTLLPENHLDILNCAMNIACTYFHLENYKEALLRHQEVYEKRKIVQGEDHKDTLVSMLNVGLTHIALGNLSEALQTHRECYDKQMIVLGKTHPDTIHSKASIAYVYYNMGQFPLALEIYQEVYEEREIVLGPDHPKTLETKGDIANSLGKLGKYAEAFQMHQEVYEKQKIVLGDSHPETQKTKASIDGLYTHLIKHSIYNGETLPTTQEFIRFRIERRSLFQRFLIISRCFRKK